MPAFCTRAKSGIDLTPVEFRIMELFMKHPGKVFTKQQLYECGLGRRVLRCGQQHHGLHQQASREAGRGSNAYIKTIRGLGYRLEKN